MKYLVTLLIFSSSFFIYSQNIIYFERLNDFTDFSMGQGQVQLQEVGVSSSIDIMVRYFQLDGGIPISSGWINHTGGVYNDVYEGDFEVIGVYYGDTLIKSAHDFLITNYEITNVTASGFDDHGLYDATGGGFGTIPWEINVQLSGPSNNSDAYVTSTFNQTVYSIDNEMILDINSVPFVGPNFSTPILINNEESEFSINAFNVNYSPQISSGAMLNAYIPRVINRPETVADCDGIIDFQRVSMASDVELEYSINDSPFATLVNDEFTNLCAFDTLKVIGFSPSVLPGDTLLVTQYVLRSIDSLGVDYDLAEVDITLNDNNPNASGCDNIVTFSDFQGAFTNNPYGMMLNEFNQYLTVSVEPNFNEYGSLCQSKYTYTSIEFGNNMNMDDMQIMLNFFTFTILDENNNLNGIPLEFDVHHDFFDTLTCNTDLFVDRALTSDYSKTLSYRPYELNGTNYENGTIVNMGYYTDSIRIEELCPGPYILIHDLINKLVYVTDSMQQLDVTYDSYVGDGISDKYVLIPDVDTLRLIYEECTNDYSQPFNTIDYNKTNSQVLQTPIPALFNIEQFNSSFDLTQSGNQIFLHEREVIMTNYNTGGGNLYPYYIIAELYCDSSNRSNEIKRRRITIAPDGTIKDEYGSFANTNELTTSSIEVNLFPNPSSESFSLQSSQTILDFQIFSTSGRLIQSIKLNELRNEVIVDVSSLDSGTYFIQVGTDSGALKKIFIKN